MKWPCNRSADKGRKKMRRALTLVLVVALGALIFAPAALAQDDNPTGDDLGGEDRGRTGLR